MENEEKTPIRANGGCASPAPEDVSRAGRSARAEEEADEEQARRLKDKLKGWTAGLRRAKAASKGDLTLDRYSKSRQKWAPVGAFQGGSPAVQDALASVPFKALQVEEILFYDTQVFQLQGAVLDMIAGAEPRVRETGLHGLHLGFDSQWDRSKSFKSHRKKMNGPLYNSDHGAWLRREFQKFVCEFIAPHVRKRTNCRRIYFQGTPCLRIQPPSNNRLGYPHTDSMYFHQRGQINFWVPLTRVYDTNTLWLESRPGAQDYHPLELDVGQCARFYGNQCTHFTLANDTQDTRVSLDLRIVPEACFDPDPPDSRGRDGRPIFFVGGYYAAADYDDDTDSWKIVESTLSHSSFDTD